MQEFQELITGTPVTEMPKMDKKEGYKFTATARNMLKEKKLQNIRPGMDLSCWVKKPLF